jgi:hypothetical protein
MDMSNVRRKHLRPLRQQSATAFSGRTSAACVIVNESSAGACVKLLEDAPIGSIVSLFTGASDPVRDCQVAWKNGQTVGLRFRT